MHMKLSALSKEIQMKTVFLALFLLAFSSKSIGVDFFAKPIDYWSKERKEEKKESPQATVSAPAPPVQQATEPQNTAPFAWDKHVNPKNDEFFKEGDYTPSKAF